jgi:succinyl-diaminopimelate desuccinylase
MGDSAATRCFRCLHELAPVELEDAYAALLKFTHPSGVGLGIDGRDEASRDLTCNLGVARMTNATLRLAFNVRYPTTWTIGIVASRCVEGLKEIDSLHAELMSYDDSPPLYFPLDHPLVGAIVEAYREETGDMKEPGVMGGGTYARMIPNTVSIGTGWAGDGRAHENDERIRIEHLFKLSRIYARILLRLVELARADAAAPALAGGD